MQMTSRQGRVTLDSNRVIGSGGEATVYAVKGNRKMVAKVYHQPTTGRGDKLRMMVGNAPVDPGRAQGHVSIAWPEDILFDSTGSVAGYLMPAIRGSYPFSEVYHPGARRRALPAGFGYQYLLRTAHNLCVAVSAIHDMGYVIGDLNESNILVQPDARVTLIDCDSFQVGPFRCLVGRPEYTAPELQGANLATMHRKAEQDNFALAVLVYQLLMRGRHPYAGIGEPGELGERIRAALCPLAPGGPKPPRGAWPVEWLPGSLQGLFRAAFVDGHRSPAARPKARAWADQLLQAEKELVTCRHDPSHPHFRHLTKCPACQVRASRPRRARKARTVPGNTTSWQRPLPGLHTRTKGSMRQRVVLAIVLSFVATLAYNWPSSSGRGGRLATPVPTGTGSQNRTIIHSQAMPAPRAREPRKLETGSEIYHKQTGRNPYRGLHGAGQADTGVPNMQNWSPGNAEISPGKEKYDLETGSDIYKQYIGKAPY